MLFFVTWYKYDRVDGTPLAATDGIPSCNRELSHQYQGVQVPRFRDSDIMFIYDTYFT